MHLTVFNVLVCVAGVLAIVSMIKPSLPLTNIGLLLVTIALLVGK